MKTNYTIPRSTVQIPRAPEPIQQPAKAEHTPGILTLESDSLPLCARAGGYVVLTGGGQPRAEYMPRNTEAHANIVRAIACWNACEKMPDPAAEIARLREVNAALATAASEHCKRSHAQAKRLQTWLHGIGGKALPEVDRSTLGQMIAEMMTLNTGDKLPNLARAALAATEEKA